MNQEQIDFLSLLHLPGRFTVQQTAWYLGFPAREIPFLTRRKLLTPTGKPSRKATKLYNYSRLRRLRDSEKWMDKASYTIFRNTEYKNRKARLKRRRKS